VRRLPATLRLSIIDGKSEKSPNFGASWRPIEHGYLKPIAVKSPSICAKDFVHDVLAEYRHRAAECERLAQEALTEEHRQTILKIAASWRQMAD
jgi:hypothetical protein